MIQFGIAGFSGSGKTTLVVRLIPELISRGLSVSTIKHTHHNVAIDRRGDLSRRLREAGAHEVLLSGSNRWSLLHELRGAPEPTVADFARRLASVDLLIVEGFKHHGHEKLEVHRPGLGKPMLWPDDPKVVAVASDVPIAGLHLPRLDVNDIPAIADFIIKRYGLGRSSVS
jgi:molybdopterin-guanine dinucleotide biosynthesis protein B